MERKVKKFSLQSKELEEKSRLVEQLYVHDVYERISVDFEAHCYQPWPLVKDFLSNMEPGSLVADIGCGNGHYLNINPSITVVGVDRSSSLLASANERSTGVTCRADCLSLPFKDNLFDAVLFLGVLHHLVTPERQAKALAELNRILRPSGTILLSMWAYEQQTRKFKGQNLLVPRQLAAADHDMISTHSCNCCPTGGARSHKTKHELKLRDKIGKFFFSSDSLLGRLLNRQNSLDSTGDDSSSTDSVHSATSAEPSETEREHNSIEVPAEFQVREFPASSLFSTTSNRELSESCTQMRVHSRDCQSQSCSSQLLADSRFDRFYHVFKSGEMEALLKQYVSSLHVITCSYNSGHWLATLQKY